MHGKWAIAKETHHRGVREDMDELHADFPPGVVLIKKEADIIKLLY